MRTFFYRVLRKFYAITPYSKLRRFLYRFRLEPIQIKILHEIFLSLEKDGVAISSLENLAKAGIHIPKQLIDRTLEKFDAPPPRPINGAKSYIVKADIENLTREQEIFLLGLNHSIINLITHYIGKNISYRGVQARCDLADESKVETRQWHYDYEDERIIKIIIYLKDVGEDGGPFCYVPKVANIKAKYTNNRILDEDLDPLLLKNQKKCVGLKGTVLFVDTCSILHRGAVPKVHQDRYTLWYVYNSRSPLQPNFCQPFYQNEWISSIKQNLTPTQLETLN